MSDEDAIGSPFDLTGRLFSYASAHRFDEMLGAFGPESVWDASALGLGTHTGAPAIRRFLELWIGGFDEWKIEPWMLLDLGNGVVYTAAVQTGRTRGRSDPFRMRHASVFLWRGPVVTRVTHYMDVEAAQDEAERLAQASA